VSGTAAGVVLKAERTRAAWQGEEGAIQLLSGASARLQLEKKRGRLPGQSEEMRLALGEVPLSSSPPRPRIEKRQEPVEVVETWEAPLRAVGGSRY
jgi:hypothetical protein